MSNKRYYWLKLKDDFFRDKAIKKLRRIAGGDTYVIIYLKMQLLSLKSDGKLFYDGVEDDFCAELALDLDEDTENVKITVSYLQSQGLLEQCEADSYLMTAVPAVTGSESYSAERVRRHRALHCNTDKLQCNNDVTSCNEEKEIEKEIEKDKNIIETYAAIISYLNEKAGTNYRSSSKTTRQHMHARLEEGYGVEDFQRVIDNKCADWKGTEWEKYLRPATLFGTKFESYLNQKQTKKGANGIPIAETSEPDILDAIL